MLDPVFVLPTTQSGSGSGTLVITWGEARQGRRSPRGETWDVDTERR